MNVLTPIPKIRSKFPLVFVLLCLTSLASHAQKPELVVQTGHSQWVHSVVFSPDGKYLASASRDWAIKLWNVETGAEIRSFQGHSAPVLSVAFSPDGKYLVSGGWDESIKLWNVESGAEIRSLKGHSNWIMSVTFSPDGKYIASGSADATIRLWNVETGAETRSIKVEAYVDSVAFSPDGKYIASGCDGKSIRIWSVQTGAQITSLSGYGYADYSATSLAYSPDGKYIAGGSANNTVRLWNVETGEEVRAFQGHSHVRSVAFSPDGKFIASGVDDQTVKIWSVETGEEIRSFKGHASIINSVTFSPDGEYVASGSSDKTIKLWGVQTGAEIRSFVGHSGSVHSVAFSSDGKNIVSEDSTIRLWGVGNGSGTRSFAGDSGDAHSVVVSPDGNFIASGNYRDYTFRLWSAETGDEKRSFNGHSGLVSSLAFSPDGKYIASGNSDKTIRLWSVETGSEIRTFVGRPYLLNSLAFSPLVVFSPDGKYLAGGCDDEIIRIWNVETGAEIRSFKGHSDWISSLAYSPDGKYIASGSRDKTIRLWNAATGAEIRSFVGHTIIVDAVAFSPDGKFIASGSADTTIKLWNVETGAEIRSFLGHSRAVVSLAFSPDGKYVASASHDTTTKIWDVSTGKELASLLSLDKNDWVVTTPDGLFDGSPNGIKSLLWRMDGSTFKNAPVEAFFKEFYRPGLLPEVISGAKIEPPKVSITDIDIRQPGVKIATVDTQRVKQKGYGQPSVLGNEITNRSVEVVVEVTDNNAAKRRTTHGDTSGASDLRLFRNGGLVKKWNGSVFGKSSGCEPDTAKSNGPRRSICRARIALTAGDNELSAYAFNTQNVKSNDVSVNVKGADSLKRKRVAYVLAVGVNEYANAEYNLTYAVPDSQDFSAELKRQQEKLGNFEKVEIVALNNKDATKANILKALIDISAKIQPEDSLTIYFAGHGTAQQNRFYLIPHDLGYTGPREKLDDAGLKAILSHSISDEELEAAVEGIDASQMLLVIDACNSGQALEAEEKRRGPMNSKGLAQLAYEKGMYILTAAQSYQAAKEATKLGHGFLTYALVEEGLKTPAADKEPKDGQVLLREWLDFATERVPQMQEADLKTRELTREKAQPNPKTATTETDNAQRPRVFYRRETEPHPMVIARPN